MSKFNVGDEVRIIRMTGEAMFTGRKGTITEIDDRGQLWGTWGGLALIPEEDEIENLTTGYSTELEDETYEKIF